MLYEVEEGARDRNTTWYHLLYGEGKHSKENVLHLTTIERQEAESGGIATWKTSNKRFSSKFLIRIEEVSSNVLIRLRVYLATYNLSASNRRVSR